MIVKVGETAGRLGKTEESQTKTPGAIWASGAIGTMPPP
jgi:hypothetical protein